MHPSWLHIRRGSDGKFGNLRHSKRLSLLVHVTSQSNLGIPSHLDGTQP